MAHFWADGVTKMIDERFKKMELSEEIKKAVQSEIRKDCWREVKTILSLTTDKNREDFLQHHNEDNGNICCLILDFAKMELVKENKMIQNDNDNFGKPLI